jgi:heme/copper-type cytochrome/quinol oxidase subunit 4
MSRPMSRHANWAFAALLAITALSFFNAEYVALRPLAITAIAAIAVAKVTIILFRFMELGRAPAGIRWYLVGWACACGAIIAGFWWAAR